MISVIIPTYNRGKIIERTIKSVITQSFKDWELLIIDDGSNDNTELIIKKYLNHKIKYFHKPNRGVSSARNFGIKKSMGEYIAFLDSDDVFLPNKLKTQFQEMKRHNAQISISNILKSNNKMYTNKTSMELSPEDIILGKIPVSGSSIMIASKIAKKVRFNESMKTSEDSDFIFRVLKIEKGIFIPECLVINHREKHSNRLSRNISEQLKGLESRIKQISNYELSQENESLFMSITNFQLGVFYTLSKNYVKARFCFRKVSTHNIRIKLLSSSLLFFTFIPCSKMIVNIIKKWGNL